MLSKKNRAGRKEVEEIFKNGEFINSPNLAFKFIFKKDQSSPRVSFIAPKNIAKLAVKRNSLRRLGYFLLKKYFKNLPLEIVGVFIFKKPEKNKLILENEIKNILNKIN